LRGKSIGLPISDFELRIYDFVLKISDFSIFFFID